MHSRHAFGSCVWDMYLGASGEANQFKPVDIRQLCRVNQREVQKKKSSSACREFARVCGKPAWPPSRCPTPGSSSTATRTTTSSSTGAPRRAAPRVRASCTLRLCTRCARRARRAARRSRSCGATRTVGARKGRARGVLERAACLSARRDCVGAGAFVC